MRPRLAVVDRTGAFLTWDETRDAQEMMREKITPMFGPHPDGWQADLVFVVGDPASVDRFGLLDMLPEGLPAFHYVPIEGIGLPPAWRRIWERIHPIAMSKFGAAELARLGYDAPVVYHGVDTDVFHPVDHHHPILWPEEGISIESRVQAKEAFGIPPKTTVILRTDANMPRKAWGSFMRAMAPVLHSHPDTIVFMHTAMVGEGGDMRVHRSHFAEHVAGRMVLPGFHEKYGGIPRYGLATLYNAADIYVSNSSEGFGLTIAEAVASGVPAVGLDWSAVPEVIGPAGLVVKGHLVENIYSHYWAVADEVALANATDRLVRNKNDRWRLGGAGPAHIKANFSWSKAAEQFISVFESRLTARIAA